MFWRRSNDDKSREDRSPRFVVADGILQWAFKGRLAAEDAHGEDDDLPFEQRFLRDTASFVIFDGGHEYKVEVVLRPNATDPVREAIVMAFETVQDAKEIADS